MSEIAWRDWGAEAFDEARRLDRPVLLDIGAVWCHWCHVMDDGIPGDPLHTGTYSNPQIAAYIDERFIPIKVDNDRRPDINARYNMGGWPSTVFLTPDGDPIYGETYVPPGRMLALLKYVADYFRDKKSDIAERLAQDDDVRGASDGKHSASIPLDAPERVAAELSSSYDPAFGGFGEQPKFPHIPALRFALSRAARGDDEMAEIVKTTLAQMAGGGMYDRYAGGFFRYSTTRDWSIPHYEKMLEDNAQLSELCFRAGYLLDDDALSDVGIDVHRWLFSTMRDPVTGCFAGSQDADQEEAYYGKSLPERALLPTPFIDRTIYFGWNALMVSSLVTRYRLRHEMEVLDAARRTYEFITSHVRPFHYWADGRGQGATGLLTDLTQILEASMALADVTGAVNFISDACSFGGEIVDRLGDPDGGFFDIVPDSAAIGALSRPRKDINENAAASLALIRLSAITGHQKYRSAAERAITSFADVYGRWSFFAAGYALAVQAIVEPVTRVVLVVEPEGEQLRSLQRAAWLAPLHNLLVEVQSPGAGEYPAAPDGHAAAYVCVGTVCSAPVSGADELSTLLRRTPETPRLSG